MLNNDIKNLKLEQFIYPRKEIDKEIEDFINKLNANKRLSNNLIKAFDNVLDKLKDQGYF